MRRRRGRLHADTQQATVFIDSLPILPESWRWQRSVDLVNWYTGYLGDPLMRLALEGHGTLTWFKTFLLCECLFQLPVFFILIWAISNDAYWSPVLLLAYAVHALTAVLPCLSSLVAMTLEGGKYWHVGHLVTLIGLYGYYGVVSLYIIIDTTRALVKALEGQRVHKVR